MSVLLNEGHGAFEERIVHIAMPTPPGRFAAADFDDDGLTDLAVLTSSGVSIYENSGRGYGPFTLIGSYTLASPDWIVTADFKKDGYPDLAVSLSGGGIGILLGQGSGQFAAPIILPSGPLSMIALGDFNEDGNVDIVATSNQIFLGNGDGTIAAPQPLLAGSLFTNNSLVWLTPIHADLNRNELDLAVFTSAGNYEHFYMLINDGKATFHLNTTKFLEALAPSELAVADFQRGRPARSHVLSNGVETPALGNGDGTFTINGNVDCVACFLAGDNIATGDFNEDGNEDFPRDHWREY